MRSLATNRIDVVEDGGFPFIIHSSLALVLLLLRSLKIEGVRNDLLHSLLFVSSPLFVHHPSHSSTRFAASSTYIFLFNTVFSNRLVVSVFFHLDTHSPFFLLHRSTSIHSSVINVSTRGEADSIFDRGKHNTNAFHSFTLFIMVVHSTLLSHTSFS